MIFVHNQLSTPPDERVEAYLKKCFDAHYEQNGGEEQLLKDLGHEPGQQVIREEDFTEADLRRIMQQISN